MVSPEIVVKRVSLTSVICWPLREGHRIIMESFLWYIPMTRHVLYKMYNHSPEVSPWYIQDSDIELSRLMIYFYWCFPANSKIFHLSTDVSVLVTWNRVDFTFPRENHDSLQVVGGPSSVRQVNNPQWAGLDLLGISLNLATETTGSASNTLQGTLGRLFR